MRREGVGPGGGLGEGSGQSGLDPGVEPAVLADGLTACRKGLR